ncbi:MAG: hypothetical protein NTY19_24080 [Planctomycetota bacterium]|nr:hypothetical protein [Planctomycetota bacterium]
MIDLPQTDDQELDALLARALAPTATDADREALADYCGLLVDCLDTVIRERDAAANVGGRTVLRLLLSLAREWEGPIPARVVERFIHATLADLVCGRFTERCEQFVADREAAET